jgi:hypothetical protein
MIARTKQRIVWVLVAVTALSAATLAIFYGTAQAQSFPAASTTSSVEDVQSANRNDAPAIPSQPIPEPAAHLVVAPGDSLWSITQKRLDPSATPEQLMNEVELTFEFNRDRIGDDPNLILPGQELSLPPMTKPAAEEVSEPMQEPVVLSELPDREAVPSAAEIGGAPYEFYTEVRRLLGLGILLLSFVIAILGACKLYSRREFDSPASRRVRREGYSENYAPVGGPGEPVYPSGPLSGSLVSARDTDEDTRMALLPTKVYEAHLVGRGGVETTSSAMLLTMAEGEDYYTPPQAARILRLSRQRVTQMLQSGEIEGKQDPQSGRWKIPQRVVHARLKDRPARARTEDGGSQDEQERSQRLSSLELEVRDLNYRLGRSEAHLELTERTESTSRAERERLLEDLEREGQRADRLETELREARRPW